jgi:hypothetical protein
LSKINEKLFEKKKNTLPLITPKLDVEQGNSFHCRQVNLNVKCVYPDLELGFGPIVEAEYGGADVIIDIQGFEKCNIIENYVSFMDAINYLSTPMKDRLTMNMQLSFIFEEETSKYKNSSELPLHMCMDSSSQDSYIIEMPLHLPINHNS